MKEGRCVRMLDAPGGHKGDAPRTNEASSSLPSGRAHGRDAGRAGLRCTSRKTAYVAVQPWSSLITTQSICDACKGMLTMSRRHGCNRSWRDLPVARGQDKKNTSSSRKRGPMHDRDGCLGPRLREDDDAFTHRGAMTCRDFSRQQKTRPGPGLDCRGHAARLRISSRLRSGSQRRSCVLSADPRCGRSSRCRRLAAATARRRRRYRC